MRRVIVHLIAALFLCVSAASAQNLDIDRMSKDDVNKLPEAQVNALPVFKVWEKQGIGSVSALKASALMDLRDLGYGFHEAFTGNDDQLQRWVTQFQHDIGEPETGILTVAQMGTLMKRLNVVETSDVTVGLPLGDKDGPQITLNKDYASATGTFIIEGDQIAEPLNITSFKCFRQWGYCYQSDVDLDEQIVGSGYLLSSYQSLLAIVSWSDEEVVANNEALCATTTTTINAQAKEVYAITRNNGNQSCGKLMPPLAKPQISKLVSGFNVSREYFVKKRKEADGYRSKEYQQYLEAMRVAGSAETSSQSKTQTNTTPRQ
jgi:hypothetical protein